MDENIGRDFSPLNVSACFSTTWRAMDNWLAQSDSTHQIGLGPTHHRVLIVVWWCCTRLWWFNLVWAQFLCPAILCFGLYHKTHGTYGQTEATSGFGALKWSKLGPPRCSDCRLLMLYKVVKMLWAEFFALRLWRCTSTCRTGKCTFPPNRKCILYCSNWIVIVETFELYSRSCVVLIRLRKK